MAGKEGRDFEFHGNLSHRCHSDMCFFLRQEVLKSIDVHISILFLTTVMSNLQHLQHLQQ